MGFLDNFVGGLFGLSQDEMKKKLEEVKRRTPEEQGKRWNELGRELREAVKKDMAAQDGRPDKAERRARREAKRLKRFVTDPHALDELTDAELDHLRLTTQSQIDYAENALSENEKAIKFADANPGIIAGLNADMAEAANQTFQEEIRDGRLLLSLIDAKKERKDEPKPPPDPETKRSILQAEVKRLEEES